MSTLEKGLVGRERREKGGGKREEGSWRAK
jgi:hypothetical protein